MLYFVHRPRTYPFVEKQQGELICNFSLLLRLKGLKLHRHHIHTEFLNSCSEAESLRTWRLQDEILEDLLLILNPGNHVLNLLTITYQI